MWSGRKPLLLLAQNVAEQHPRLSVKPRHLDLPDRGEGRRASVPSVPRLLADNPSPDGDQSPAVTRITLRPHDPGTGEERSRIATRIRAYPTSARLLPWPSAPRSFATNRRRSLNFRITCVHREKIRLQTKVAPRSYPFRITDVKIWQRQYLSTSTRASVQIRMRCWTIGD